MAQSPAHPRDWLKVTSTGLLIEPAGILIDPLRPADRALITHGHADHARPNNAAVLATPETLAIMRARYGKAAGQSLHPLPYGQALRDKGVEIMLYPAGHVLGSAQVALRFGGQTVVVSGDYKRASDPTCPPFEPVACDLFITEATFGLPVFRHPDPAREIERLLRSQSLFPDRAHLVGVYALGKAQRVITLLRAAGHDRPIFVHGALQALCALYEAHGIKLGPLRPITDVKKTELAGEIVLAPPSALQDRWSRRLPDPLTVLASGWMQVRARARQRGIELPLILSDHADWDGLTQTIEQTGAPEIWITHGREEALVRHCALTGRKGLALALAGREEEDE